jgi:two-component system, cell cycle sensor histidine kinase and response regulator CckA
VGLIVSGSPIHEARGRLWPFRAAWVYFGCYAVWVGAMLAGTVPRELLNDLIFLPFYFGAGAAAWHAAEACGASRRTARGWRLVGAAWVVSGIATMLMAPLWLTTIPLLETLSLAVYQIYFPLLLLGFWHFIELPAGAPARIRLVVEGLIAVAGTVILAWYWVFRFDEAAQSLLHYLRLILVMFPGELAVALGAVVIMHRPAEASARKWLSLLSVGTLAAVVADLVYEYDDLIWSTWSGPVGDLLLALAALLVISAGLSVRPEKDSRPHPTLGLGPALVPYLAIVVVGALAVMEWWRPDPQHPGLSGLVLGVVVLMALLIVRLVVAQREFAGEARARAAQDSRFRALVQRSSDAILVVGRDGRIRYASPPFGAIIGAPGTEHTGRRLADLVTFDSPGRLEDWLADPAAQPLARWRAGEHRYIEARATDHSADPCIGGVVINARDVSERIALELRLQQAQKLEAVGRFASSVAHDFNNVLTVITANLHFLRDRDRARDLDELNQMETAATRGAALARQLTALSRPKTATVATVDLAAAVRSIEQTLYVLLPSSIQTRVTVPDTTVRVRLDEVQVEQVLLNLALNSRDAMPEGGRLDVMLSLIGAPPRAPQDVEEVWARLTVSDSGIGMSAEVLRQALEPFFTTKGSSHGTGLGLSSVQAIVSGAGGRVDLDSAPGAGTTVSVWLPLVAAPVAPPKPPRVPVVPRGEGRLLVVDDEPAVRRILVRYLTNAGYRVLDCEDGLEALKKLEDCGGTIDLVLSDLVMPGMSGQELMTRICERWPSIPLLLMSGTPDVIAGRPEPWAAQPVMAKPLDFSEVAARIEAALRPGVA